MNLYGKLTFYQLDSLEWVRESFLSIPVERFVMIYLWSFI